MRITVAGSGYVGLVTEICFAESGVNVARIDVEVEVEVDKIKQHND